MNSALSKQIKTTFLGLWVFVLSFLLLPPYLRAQTAPFRGTATIAGTPISVNVYDPKSGRTDGISARIIPPHPRGPGYQDWTVELRRFDGKPFDRDHAIRAKIILSYDENGPSAEIDVPLKQGAIIASQTFHVPCWFYPYYWQARFYSNGYELKGLRSNFQNFSVFQSHVENNRLFVFDDDDEKAQAYLEEYSGQLTSLLVEYRKSEIWCIPLNGNQTNPGTQSANTADIAMRSRLPQDWLSYSRYAALVLTKDALEKIDSAQAEALGTYMMGGGTVIITRCESQEDSQTIEGRDALFRKLMNDPSVDAEWEVDRSGKRNVCNLGFGLMELNTEQELKVTDTSNSNATSTTIAATNSSAAFPNPVTLPTATTIQVAAAAKQKPSLYYTLPISGNRAMLYTDRNSWSGMHGTSNGSTAGTNFWNWLIPNVGKPPVWAFAAFIVLFAGIAGPALAYFTIRARRPSWLIILFPVIALGVTLVLSLYAILHDGFRSVARVRSVAYYDLRADLGFAWSRQTLFSGAPPSSGLVFHRETEIVPMTWKDEFNYYRSSLHPRTVWQGDEQRLLGLLPHREQRQFMVRHPLRNTSPFRVTRRDDGTIEFENKLDDALPLVLVKISAEESAMAESIQPRSKVTLAAIPSNDARTKLRTRIMQESPDLPEGLVQGQQVSVIDWMQNRSSLANWNVSEPLMEVMISDLASPSVPLPDQSFVALLEQANYLDRPLKATEYHSLHVMVGRW